MLLAPVVSEQKGEFRDVIERLAREGFVRARVDGELVELSNNVRVKLDPKQRHTIEAIVDRLVIDDKIRVRLSDSVETALNGAKAACCCCSSRATAPGADGSAWTESLHSNRNYSPATGQSFEHADAETFFLQFAAGGVPGLPRPGAENGFRRASDRARRGKIAGKRRGPAVAARRQADDGLLQGAVARHGRSITARAWKRRGRICRRISNKSCCAAPGDEEIEFTFWRAGKMSQAQEAVRRRHSQPGTPLRRERKRVHQEPA